jgi:hypothetical protein
MFGQEMKTNTYTVTKASCEVKGFKDGNYVLDMRYKEFFMNMNVPSQGLSVEIDSKTTEEVATIQNLSPMFKVIIDKPIELVMSDRGKIRSVSGSTQLLDAMDLALDKNIDEAVRSQLLTQMGQQLSDESIGSTFDQFSFFPEKPIGLGDDWHVTADIHTGGFVLSVDMKMTLKTIENGIAIIDGDGVLSSSEGQKMVMGNGMEAEMTLNGTQKGIIRIDLNTGWNVGMDLTQNVDGEISMMGNTILLTIESKVTAMDN